MSHLCEGFSSIAMLKTKNTGGSFTNFSQIRFHSENKKTHITLNYPYFFLLFHQ